MYACRQTDMSFHFIHIFFIVNILSAVCFIYFLLVIINNQCNSTYYMPVYGN